MSTTLRLCSVQPSGITVMKRLAHGVLEAYDFVGVFQINAELSKEKNMCVWERISDTYELNVF